MAVLLPQFQIHGFTATWEGQGKEAGLGVLSKMREAEA